MLLGLEEAEADTSLNHPTRGKSSNFLSNGVLPLSSTVVSSKATLFVASGMQLILLIGETTQLVKQWRWVTLGLIRPRINEVSVQITWRVQEQVVQLLNPSISSTLWGVMVIPGLTTVFDVAILPTGTMVAVGAAFSIVPP